MIDRFIIVVQVGDLFPNPKQPAIELERGHTCSAAGQGGAAAPTLPFIGRVAVPRNPYLLPG